ncbi:15126_t:CDS:2, partial [Funneliformis mosseae]
AAIYCFTITTWAHQNFLIWKKHGIMKITYKSIVEFHNARRQVMSLVARDSTVSEN